MRREDGITGKNVAAAVLFWPALARTCMNTDEAINAARRQGQMMALHRKKIAAAEFVEGSGVILHIRTRPPAIGDRQDYRQR